MIQRRLIANPVRASKERAISQVYSSGTQCKIAVKSSIIVKALASKDLSRITTVFYIGEFDVKSATATCCVCPARVYCVRFCGKKILLSTVSTSVHLLLPMGNPTLFSAIRCTSSWPGTPLYSWKDAWDFTASKCTICNGSGLA